MLSTISRSLPAQETTRSCLDSAAILRGDWEPRGRTRCAGGSKTPHLLAVHTLVHFGGLTG